MRKVFDTCAELLRATPLKVVWLLALVNLPLRWLAFDIFIAVYLLCWPLALSYSISRLYPETAKRRATLWLAVPFALNSCWLIANYFFAPAFDTLSGTLELGIAVAGLAAYFIGLWKVASTLVSLEENPGTPPRDTLSTFFALFYHFFGGSVWINARARAVNPEI